MTSTEPLSLFHKKNNSQQFAIFNNKIYTLKALCKIHKCHASPSECNII